MLLPKIKEVDVLRALFLSNPGYMIVCIPDTANDLVDYWKSINILLAGELFPSF